MKTTESFNPHRAWKQKHEFRDLQGEEVMLNQLGSYEPNHPTQKAIG
jgi:hypothetical protein